MDKTQSTLKRLIKSPVFWGIVSLLAVITAALLWYPPLHQKSYKPISYEPFLQKESDDTVNVNTAGKQELMLLHGVGEHKAGEIIAHREAHGRFNSLDDFAQVAGIGPKIIQDNEKIISFGDE